ncbi:MAG: ComEC family competence protein, partial [Sedimentisphaerales bacterium]|nr:ComEC family competence protein [Sedimentisphaerales bacterium]
MDPIQRKLELIDRQLAGGDFHKRIITTAPLVFAAVGLILGIILQQAFSGPPGGGDPARFPWGWVLLLAFCSLAAIALFTANKKYSRPLVIAYAALVCFVCLGAIRMISFKHPAPDDIQKLVGSNPKLAQVRGVIITDPYVERHEQWAFARFKPTDPTSSFYLKLSEAETVDGWAKVRGTVRAQVDAPILDLKPGDYIEAYCLLDRFKPATNPGQFDTAAHLARRNIFVAASIKSRDGIELLQSPPAAFFTKVRARIRQTAAQALLGDLPSDDSGRGILQAFLLGYRGDIDSRTYRAFRRTGLLHFVSLSGMHFGILIGIVWWLAKTAGLMKPGRAIICIFAIALFLMVVPARAPTVRAAVMGWVFCASFLFRRRPNAMNTLSLAAIVLLLIRPTQLFEAGWQLSFGTVFGILLFEQRIKHAINDAVERLTSELDYRKSWIAARLVRGAVRGALPMFSV